MHSCKPTYFIPEQWLNGELHNDKGQHNDRNSNRVKSLCFHALARDISPLSAISAA